MAKSQYSLYTVTNWDPPVRRMYEGPSCFKAASNAITASPASAGDKMVILGILLRIEKSSTQ
jgi:hypothetical protein